MSQYYPPTYKSDTNVQALYDRLPEGPKKAIEKRDGKT